MLEPVLTVKSWYNNLIAQQKGTLKYLWYLYLNVPNYVLELYWHGKMFIVYY